MSRFSVHIVYIHQHFRTPALGGATRSYEFARRLVERGHQVDIVTADPRAPSGSPWRMTTEAGAIVHWVGVHYDNAMPFRRRLAALGQFAYAAAGRVAGLKQDLVLASSTPLTVALPGIWSARRNRVPMVFEVRDLWPAVPIAMGALGSPLSRGLARALERWAYRSAAHVITLSPDTAADIHRRFPRVPTSVVPNSCDVDLFANVDRGRVRDAHPWLGARPLILYAGALGQVNDLRYLVRMAVSLSSSRPDVRIAIIGNGSEERQIRQFAADSHVLDRNLFMLAPMAKTEVASWFAAADIGISTVIDRPGLSANSANKVFDSWAAGRPVAINHGGWVADVLNRTGAGLVLPARDPVTASQMIVEFLDDTNRVSTARAAADRLAHGDFARDRLFDTFERVLLNAANGTSERAAVSVDF